MQTPSADPAAAPRGVGLEVNREGEISVQLFSLLILSVQGLPVLRLIEALDLFFLCDTKACCVFADHEDKEGDHRALADHHDQPQQLFKYAGAGAGRIYICIGEDRCQ